MQRRKGLPIPEGWAQDKKGNVTTDAHVAYEAGCLMPLGGGEIHSGFKGSGLALMLEVLGAVLAGIAKGNKIVISRNLHQSVSRCNLWSKC